MIRAEKSNPNYIERTARMSQDKVNQLFNLFVKTVWAHHEHQERDLNGVYNVNWAPWYASFLIDNGVGDVLGYEINEESLTRFLVDVDKKYRREKPNQEWPVYYAIQLAKTDGEGH
jgi:hypothetical protein